MVEILLVFIEPDLKGDNSLIPLYLFGFFFYKFHMWSRIFLIQI